MTDLGSTNGTYLDEEELPPNRAADVYVGSKIVFGEPSPASLMEISQWMCLLGAYAAANLWETIFQSQLVSGKRAPPAVTYSVQPEKSGIPGCT